MTYQLRAYQTEAVQEALRCLERGKPFIIQAATGAGKSLMIADLCHKIDYPVLILQPSKELLDQNYDKLRSYGVDDVSIYSASKNTKEIARYTYATIGSIYKRPDLFKHFGAVLIDECHLVNPKNNSGMYGSFLKALGCKRICGLTATPYRICQVYRTDSSGMTYTDCVLKMLPRIGWPTFWSGGITYKIETADLIEQGFLAPISYFVSEVDLKGLMVNSTGMDYTEESMEVFWSDARLIDMANRIKIIDKHCKRNLIFCSSIRQADKATRMLVENGIPAALVTGKTPAAERERIVKDFRNGTIKHLVNVGVFTTGFDVPELDSIVLARPTMSLPLYYQMVGRGVRLDPTDPKKMLKVHDLAGCVKRLGKVENVRIVKMNDGYKDQIVSDAGIMTETVLSTFQVPKK